MKKLLIPFLSLLLMAGCFGCGTGPQKVALETVGTTVISVDLAMREWGAYVKLTHPPVSQEEAVKLAYAKYQLSMATVCDVGAIYAGANGQTNLQAQASASLQVAMANAQSEIVDLENLIQSFGMKLEKQ